MIVYGVDLARPGGDMMCKATFERLPDGTFMLKSMEFEELEPTPQSDAAENQLSGAAREVSRDETDQR
jgi:hypothetical protein